ncbi:MAG: hypothetical protein QM775_28820 [Pirellulales bacterium]
MKFGVGVQASLIYTVIVDEAAPQHPRIGYASGWIMITIAPDDVDKWIRGNCVGFEHVRQSADAAVRVILEKDFACLDRPGDEEADDAWAFANTSSVC